MPRRRVSPREEGLELILARETSWANIRDRLAVGHFDVAHCLAPLTIAVNLGLAPLPTPLVTVMSLNLGGHTFTVSNELWRAMVEAGAPSSGDAAATGLALKRVIAARAAVGRRPLMLAIVHRFSAHNYDLRYWLAAAGIVPDTDVTLIAVPPPLMADALATGQIDGFCVGEPWGSVAVAAGAGHIVTSKGHIWRSSPDKVLATRTSWAENNPDRLNRLIRAVYRAAVWCDAPDNRAELAHILSRQNFLGQAEDSLARGLSGRLMLGEGSALAIPDFLVFSRNAACFPWISHALWFFSQMARWRDADLSPQAIEVARRSYRPDLYREALAPLGLDLPDTDTKVEGLPRPGGHGDRAGNRGPAAASTGFFDGRIFDPGDVAGYVARFDIPGR